MTVKWTINDAVAQSYIDGCCLVYGDVLEPDDDVVCEEKRSPVSLEAFFADPGADPEDDDDPYPLQHSETQAILIPQRAFRDGQNYTIQVSYEVGRYQLSDTFEFSFVPLSCLYSEVHYARDDDV